MFETIDIFADLHIHSTASDGTDTPEQILEKISEVGGVKIFALTDHDTISGVEQIKNKIPQNIFFVNGVEFSCKTASGNKCHILGYFYDATNKDFQEILEQGKNLHAKKLELRLNFLSELYKINFSADDVKKICENEIVGKPHIVNFIFEKFGIAKQKIYSDLRKCEIDARLDAKKVIDAIKISGGISVWAHPLGGEGEKCSTQAEFEKNLAELNNLGIEGLEIYYSRYNAEQRKILISAAEKNNLLISGGSDFHGKNKNISLFELGRDNPQIKVWRLTILQKIFEKHSDARVRKAFEIAKKAHAGQVDKAGTDYIFHPMTVALNFCGDTSAMIVGLLHDVVEDTNFTFEDLQKIPLTEEELQALKLLTHDKKIAYPDYIAKIKTNALAKKVKYGDLNHNLDYSRFLKNIDTLSGISMAEYAKTIETLPEDCFPKKAENYSYADAFYDLQMK